VHHARARIRVDVARMFCRGITLLELLAVLAIVGIVAALALPSFQRQVARTYRTEAMTSLLALQSAEETFYLRHGAYTANVAAAPPAGLGLPVGSASNKYLLSVALAADGQTYVATASPAPDGGQSADLECLAFSVDSRGRRSVSGTGELRRCWR
jgi:type IV pilus assembly protein PilE